jgi:hypothetical protein
MAIFLSGSIQPLNDILVPYYRSVKCCFDEQYKKLCCSACHCAGTVRVVPAYLEQRKSGHRHPRVSPLAGPSDKCSFIIRSVLTRSRGEWGGSSAGQKRSHSADPKIPGMIPRTRGILGDIEAAADGL